MTYSRLKTTPIKTAKPGAHPFLPILFAETSGGAAFSAGGEILSFAGDIFACQAEGSVTGKWTLAQREFLIFSLTVKATQPTLLNDVVWFSGQWDSRFERAVNSTNMQDAFLFLRRGNVSFFVSLDFPYSRITEHGITYPPHERLKTGQTLTCHSLTLGACRLTGQRVGNFDKAEIEAASAYVERRFPLRFERPMFTSTCITNRMTECRDGRIFYNMEDNPTIGLSPDLLEEDIRLMAELGVEYFQMFEGVFDWPDQTISSRNMQRLMKLGRKLGVRLGDYVHPGGPFIPHYNYDGRALNRPDWLQRNPDGTSNSHACLGCADFLRYVKAPLLAHNRKYRAEFICMDMLSMAPCYAENHGHAKGDLYQQVRGLVSLMDELAALSSNYLVWTNSGNWIEFMPKLIWSNPNVYLTDPHVREYESTLNQLKLLGDNRREQMVTVHERHFVPYRAFCNCEYYAFPRNRVSDLRVFEYSFLQGLAVTPNICPCETRTFFNRIPGKDRDACAAFMRHWMQFVAKNFDAWKHTRRVGEAPGVGATEIYSHIRSSGDGGFVCLVNQNSFPRTARFSLDASLGLTAGDRFLIREIYPRDCPVSEQTLPYAARGEELHFDIPPHSVRFLSVAPYKASPGLSIYGHPARIERKKGGYRITLRAPQGETLRLGLVLPPGETVTAVTARQTPSVPIFTFPVIATLAAGDRNLARVEVTLPRGRAPRALTQWRILPDDVAVTLPRSGECGFLGALVHGAYSEEIEAHLDVTVARKPGAKVTVTLPSPAVADKAVAPLSTPAKQQTFITEFELPFIETMGLEPGYEDDTVMELAFVDPSKIESLSARLNDKAIEVRRYYYPRQKESFSYYIELTGNTGPGRLVLQLEVLWK